MKRLIIITVLFLSLGTIAYFTDLTQYIGLHYFVIAYLSYVLTEIIMVIIVDKRETIKPIDNMRNYLNEQDIKIDNEYINHTDRSVIEIPKDSKNKRYRF